jgi:formylglycine-generating enzyme required for sulfatase activity
LFTDLVTKNKILHKPISLRHPYIFYLGHLPAFMDLQISRVLSQPVTEPAYFGTIFERGIDPIMEDPSICHQHSVVPDEWPTYEDVIEYRNKVQNRVRNLLVQGDFPKELDRRLKRVLNMCFEHEGMHFETLLYMYVQDPTISNHMLVPKPILQTPSPCPSATWVSFAKGMVELGISDCEAFDSIGNSGLLQFGWDNENPKTLKNVESFEIQHRPVTIGEYFKFLQSKNFSNELTPASWENQSNTWMVKTVYGLIPMDSTLNWPVYCSHFQASLYAAEIGGRLPKEEEIALIRYTDNQATGNNHSFKHMLPRDVVPSSENVTDLVGNGWELTSTIFEPFAGYEKSSLYPGYSSDFL